MKPLLSRLAAFNRAHALLGPRDRVLAAVSGGADSACLAHWLSAQRAKGRLRALTLVHFHHGLRGRAADRDAASVRAMAAALPPNTRAILDWPHPPDEGAPEVEGLLLHAAALGSTAGSIEEAIRAYRGAPTVSAAPGTPPEARPVDHGPTEPIAIIGLGCRLPGASSASRLWEQLLATGFQAHPYGRPVIGWPSDIAVITRTATERYFRRHYGPNRMILSVVGEPTPTA